MSEQISEGIVPLIELLLRYRWVSCVSKPISDGIVPVSPRLWRLSVVPEYEPSHADGVFAQRVVALAGGAAAVAARKSARRSAARVVE